MPSIARVFFLALYATAFTALTGFSAPMPAVASPIPIPVPVALMAPDYASSPLTASRIPLRDDGNGSSLIHSTRNTRSTETPSLHNRDTVSGLFSGLGQYSTQMADHSAQLSN